MLAAAGILTEQKLTVGREPHLRVVRGEQAVRVERLEKVVAQLDLRIEVRCLLALWNCRPASVAVELEELTTQARLLLDFTVPLALPAVEAAVRATDAVAARLLDCVD